MKNKLCLTDKIVNMMTEYSGEQHNPHVASAINSLIYQIRELEETADFEESARVLIKHLSNPYLYHPHFRVIVDSTGAELLEGNQGTGQILDYITD